MVYGSCDIVDCLIDLSVIEEEMEGGVILSYIGQSTCCGAVGLSSAVKYVSFFSSAFTFRAVVNRDR